MIEDFKNKIICGDCLDVLKTLPSESVDCIMTSPPYWTLRDYGVDGQLGLESTFQEYLTKLCNIFDEVKRVLKNTGTCWVNLGDVYASTEMRNEGFNERWHGKQFLSNKQGDTDRQRPKRPKTQLPKKSLCQLPSRFAIEMTNRGWILRNRIIWHKPNCMSSSIKDRFTVDYEDLFFFTKSKKYYFETQYEPWVNNQHDIKRAQNKDLRYNGKHKEGYDKNSREDHLSSQATGQPIGNPVQGRNKRCVWKIPTNGFKEAHFAVFPENLVETPIKAGCPQYICKKCGKPREKIIETEFVPQPDISPERNKRGVYGKPMDKSNRWQGTPRGTTKATTKGYTDCGCNAGFRPGIVLDPFSGAGTVAVVARKLLRDSLGIDLNHEYCKMARKRIAVMPLRLDTFEGAAC